MKIVSVPEPRGLQSIAALKFPSFDRAPRCSGEPTEAPVEEPTTVPTTPDVEPAPNTIPNRPAVPETDIPCERPDTSCPVHPTKED